MNKKVIVIDNFYDNPDLVRRAALTSDFNSYAKYNYPGYQSYKAFNPSAISSIFEEVIGKPIDYDKESLTFGNFRLITEQTGNLSKIHADVMIDWAGLVFLTPDAPLDKGVGFFKHKASGLECPPTDLEARKMGYEDSDDFEERVIKPDMDNLEKWELISYVSPLYNRLVLFKGAEIYHAPMGGFGDEPENSRLTHNFFFKEKVLV